MDIVRAFDRADAYDAHAAVQRQVADHLAKLIVALPPAPAPRILEIGCGTGFLGAALIDRLPGARWTMTDIAPAMVERAKARFTGRSNVAFAVMDGEAPDSEGPFDLICSSLAMQWFRDMPRSTGRLRSLLAPHGWLAFSTLAAGSFAEWQAAHGGMTSGIHAYPDADCLRAMGMVVEIDSLPIRYQSAGNFLHALKAIGAGTPRFGHHPLPPAALRAVMNRFEATGSIATYEVATCLAQRTEQQARP